MWEVNGLSLECDIEDVETALKVESALKNMGSTQVKKGTSLAESLKVQCNIIKKVFTDIFGEEVANSIFKDVKLNRRLYTDVLYSFYDFINEQKEAIVRRSNTLDKYIPKE